MSNRFESIESDEFSREQPASPTLPTSPSGSGIRRLGGLNLLRCLSIALVMARHLELDRTGWLSPLISVFRKGGWIGVNLFFALSGYLIFSLLIGELQVTGRLNLRRFYVRRALKILPPLYLIILPVIVLRIFDLNDREFLKAVVGELTFLQNYVGRMFVHTWSLGVEEHSYIVLSTLALFFGAQIIRWTARFPALAIGFASSGMVGFLILRLMADPERVPSLLYKTHLVADGFIPGVLASLLVRNTVWKQRLNGWSVRAILLVGVIFLMPAFLIDRSTHFMLTWGYSSVCIGSGCLLLVALKLPDHLPTICHWPMKIGAASYSIYLIHIPIAIVFFDLVNMSDFLAILGYVLCSLVAGLLIFRLFELPILTWRDRVFPSLIKTRSAIIGLNRQ
jgi:peptidoglycan/LPS O-acetylase OafA/YrhL